MAKRRGRIIIRRVGSAARRHGARFGRAALSAARDEKHTLAAMVTGGALGYMKRKGIDFPTIPTLGHTGTAGAALFILGKVTKNRMIRHAATGALAIAAFEFMQLAPGQSMSGQDDIAFDEG